MPTDCNQPSGFVECSLAGRQVFEEAVTEQNGITFAVFSFQPFQSCSLNIKVIIVKINKLAS